MSARPGPAGVDVYFCSGSGGKRAAVRCALGPHEARVGWLDDAVVELLTYDLDGLVRAKAMEAYRRSRVPLFVEHGGLYIDHLNGLPGPLIKPFWERMESGLCRLIPNGRKRSARFEQAVCLCDGRRVEVFRGVTRGRVAPRPVGAEGFHWHPVFVPEGADRSFGEMSVEERQRFTDPAPWEALIGRLWGPTS